MDNMDNLELESRYQDVKTYYTPINDYSGIIRSNGNYTRCILNEEGNAIQSIDFEGGPMLSIGDSLKGYDKKIKSIKSCYYVELE